LNAAWNAIGASTERVRTKIAPSTTPAIAA
jgi:hypothetical protein